jgi:hypothetical protein
MVLLNTLILGSNHWCNVRHIGVLLNHANDIVYSTFRSIFGYLFHGFQWLCDNPFDMLFTMLLIYTIVI